MPFDPDYTPIYEELIKKPLEAAGFEVNRADSVLTQQNILRDVIAGIATADLIVADLTDLNPNVMYELGIAHGLRIPTVLIAQSIEVLPFDLRSYRVVKYSDRFVDAPNLVAALTEVGKRRMDEGPDSFGSPVLDFLGSAPDTTPLRIPESRRGAGETPKGDSDDEAEGESDDDSAPRGFLDFVIAVEDETTRLTELLNEVTAEIEQLGEKTQLRSAELEAANNAPGGVGAREAQRLVLHSANDMRGFADAVDALLPEFTDLVDQLGEDLSSFVAHLQIEDASGEERARELRETFDSQHRMTGESLAAITAFRSTIDELPPVSQAINSAKRRILSTLDALIAAFEKHEALTARTVALIDRSLEQSESEAT